MLRASMRACGCYVAVTGRGTRAILTRSDSATEPAMRLQRKFVQPGRGCVFILAKKEALTLATKKKIWANSEKYYGHLCEHFTACIGPRGIAAVEWNRSRTLNYCTPTFKLTTAYAPRFPP